MKKTFYLLLALFLAAPAYAQAQDKPALAEDRNIMVKRNFSPEEPLHVFAGTQVRVPVIIYASGAADLNIEARLNQLASSAVSGIGEAINVFSGRLPEGEDFIHREVSVSLPELKRKAAFELRFFAKDSQDNKERFIGAVTLTVYPDDLMAPVKEWAESGRLRLDDKEGVLKQFLTDKEITFKDSKAVSLKDMTLPKVTFKTGAYGRFEESAVPSGEILVHFQKEEDFPLIAVQKSGDGTLIGVKINFIDHLNDDPLAQLTLLEIFQFIQNQ